jgi:hypothetical protein
VQGRARPWSLGGDNDVPLSRSGGCSRWACTFVGADVHRVRA